jgi:hypothetical protein
MAVGRLREGNAQSAGWLRAFLFAHRFFGCVLKPHFAPAIGH